MKTKKILSLLMSVAMICTMFTAFCVSVSATAPTDTWGNHKANSFSGGDGTENDPYLIKTAEELALVAYNCNLGDATINSYFNKFFKLENNLDLSLKKWIPIGSDQQTFNGHFNGNGKTITGLYVDESSNQYIAGLFGHIAGGYNKYIIKDLNIKDAIVITAGEARAGVLAGFSAGLGNGKGTIENCHVSGSVTSDKYAGGLIGFTNFLSCIDSTANVTVSSGGANGGFVGASYISDFTNCSAIGNVNGTWAVGGFVGQFRGNSSVKFCYATGNVTGSDWRVGGFVGLSTNDNTGILEINTINACYSTGNVNNITSNPTWKLKTGGFIGEIDNTKLSNSFSTGKVTGGNPNGGFLAFGKGGSVENCYYDNEKNSAMNAVGIDNTNGNSSFDIKGKSTGYMKSQSFIADLGPNYTMINNEIVFSKPYLVNGNVITQNDGKNFLAIGNSPVSATTTIPAPTYTVTIPETVSFGDHKQALEKYRSETNDQFGKAVVVSKDFTVSATGVANLFNDLDDNKADYINVIATFDGTLKGLKNAEKTVPYTLSQNSTTLANGAKIATFYNDVDLASKGKTNSATATITMNRADIKNADSYQGTMTFTIAVANR